jgi:hypothetical protein
VKPKNSQSSVRTHIHQTNRKSLNKRCQKVDGNYLLDRKGVLMVEFMQQGTTITSEVYFETLKVTA